MRFTLELLADTFAVCRLDRAAVVPDWARGEFVSVTRTPEELSVVCSQDAVPADVHAETGWRCLRLAGQFDLTEVGVLATLTQPLAKAGISVLVIGTFETDYLLVRYNTLDEAIRALENARWRMRESP